MSPRTETGNDPDIHVFYVLSRHSSGRTDENHVTVNHENCCNRYSNDVSPKCVTAVLILSMPLIMILLLAIFVFRRELFFRQLLISCATVDIVNDILALTLCLGFRLSGDGYKYRGKPPPPPAPSSCAG
jgi:hypothetical protein